MEKKIRSEITFYKGGKPVLAYVDEKTHSALKHYAIQVGASINSIVGGLIKTLIDQQQPKEKQ